MGLDSVELCITWEESFSIELSDEELSDIRRVSEAIELICQKLSVNEKQITCPLRNVLSWFYSTLKEISSHRSQAIHLKDKISLFYDNRSKKQFWNDFKQASNFEDFIIPSYIFFVPTVKDCLEHTLAHHLSFFVNQEVGWTRELVRYGVYQSIRHILNIKSIKDSDRFIEDLGLD